MPMKKKKPAKKTKKVVLSMSMRDFEKLSAYAKSSKASRPLAAKRLIRAQLATLAVGTKPKEAENQLGLFDSMQLDIFNGTSKTRNS